MSRKFYVTPTEAVCKYLQTSSYEVVNADEVRVLDSGALMFLSYLETANDRGIINPPTPIYVSVVYAPGMWVLFTETEGDKP